MSTYKVYVNDRRYSSWVFYQMTDLTAVDLPGVLPLEHKLFTNDVFSLDPVINTPILKHSAIRVCESIPAVLILSGTKTYGRHKNGKLLYKCMPDDMRLPACLVPYEMKQIGFSKVFNNLYVTIRITEWLDKHPVAVVSQVIGSIDILDNFYEYQLYCKSLNASIQKFTKDASKALKAQATESNESFIQEILKKYPSIEDRTTNYTVFTIDPAKSLDYDDGFSIKNPSSETTLLSIYISNVTIWLDVLNLWNSFSKRISTIYLPDRKRPMLPTILSDCLCSLQSGNTRIALVMDIFIDTASGTILSISWANAIIRVKRNYAYEEPELLGFQDYQLLLECAWSLSKKYKYINNVRNSHEVVCYLMILMNFHCAKEFLEEGNGIFRSTSANHSVTIPEALPEDVQKFIKIWNSSSGQYIKSEHSSLKHDLLEMDAYVHMTSPIRRLIDLLNMIQFQKNKGLLTLSPEATAFYQAWLGDLDYINTTMRSIRKVQNDCNMLDYCFQHPEIIGSQKVYQGYVFDKMERNDGLYQIIVYLPELKLTSRVTTRENVDNYQLCSFKVYMFHNEDKFKKKIRLQLV